MPKKKKSRNYKPVQDVLPENSASGSQAITSSLDTVKITEEHSSPQHGTSAAASPTPAPPGQQQQVNVRGRGRGRASQSQQKTQTLSTPGASVMQPSETSTSHQTPDSGDGYTKPKYLPLAPQERDDSRGNSNGASSSSSLKLPKRPDSGGTRGTKIALLVNCYSLKIDENMLIFLHDLKFEKSLDNKRLRREVVKQFMKDKQFSESGAIYDGGAAIFSLKPLTAGMNIERPISFKYRDSERDTETEYKFKIELVSNISFSQLLEYVNSGSTLAMPREPLHAIETLMRTIQQENNMVMIGRNFYFNEQISLKCGGPYLFMEGFRLSARPQKWSVVFNIDKTQTVVYEAIDVIEFVKKMNPRNIDLSKPLRPNDFRTLKKQLYHLRICASHYRDEVKKKPYTRKFTIHGLSIQSANELQLKGDQEKITVSQYFKQKYGINLRFGHLPCLKINPNNDSWLPMELAKLEPYQRAPDQKREVLQEIIQKAAVKPQTRKNAIDNYVQRSLLNKPLMKQLWKVLLDPNMANVSGRMIEGPKAEFGNQKQNLSNGKWSMQDRNRYKMFSSPAIKGNIKWAMILMGIPRVNFNVNYETPLYKFIDELKRIGKDMGLTFEDDYEYEEWPENIDPRDVEVKLTNFKGKFDIIFFVFSKDNDINYSTVKYMGDLLQGIVTQCIVYSKIAKDKGLGQYMANLLLKVNSKLGGTNWSIPDIVQFNPIINEVTVVFGIDVTHHSPTENKSIKKSLAAVVASMDKTFSRYRPMIVQQIDKLDKSKKAVEIIQDMEDIVYNHLRAYYAKNNEKPTRLIFYRDGVSEGQFEDVICSELPAIQKACRRLPPYDEYQPGITFIVVQKRHHIRLFQTNGNSEVTNPPAGTVVDTKIVHPSEFDFYLMSHVGIQGTSKPCHYHVVWDDNSWRSDDLQSFTFYLCHLCYRCTRSISYPAPTYYAHLAADRARIWVGESTTPEGSVASGQSGAEAAGNQRFMGEKLKNGSDVINIHSEHLNRQRMFFV